MNTVTKHIADAGWPLVAILGLLAAGPAWTQVPVDEAGNPLDAEIVDESLGDPESAAAENLGIAELEGLVGPIALYPDDLLAIVLPASAYPLQIVQAARFLEQLNENPGLEPDESWDDSVVALLNYPEVIEMMNEDLEWTYALGEAVVRQQPDVIAAIESFRDKAYAAGNLQSDERQTVTRENGVIEIEPASEEVIYVPYYEPERVVVYQPEPVYHYYPRPYPVYYYPYPYGYSFASGYFWGVTTAFHIGWLTDHLHVWHHSYWGHPYFGHNYYFARWWYRRPSIHVHNTFYVNDHVRRPPHHERDGDFWRPRRHSGALLDRRGFREAYYTDRRERSSAGQRREGFDRARSRSGARDDASRLVDNRDRDGSARLARNRAGAGLRERTADDSAIRFRSRDRTELARRESGDTPIRFRPRERAAVDAGRELSRRVEQPAVRRSDPAPAVRERASNRRDAEPARRVSPPSRPVERSLAPPSGTNRGAPRVSRPSNDVPRAAPRVSRPAPSAGASRPAPRVSRPSASSARPAPGVSRSSPSVSRPSSASSRSSSARSSRAAPTSRSGTRRSHNRD